MKIFVYITVLSEDHCIKILFNCLPTATPSIAINTQVIAPTTAEQTLTGASSKLI